MRRSIALAVLVLAIIVAAFVAGYRFAREFVRGAAPASDPPDSSSAVSRAQVERRVFRGGAPASASAAAAPPAAVEPEVAALPQEVAPPARVGPAVDPGALIVYPEPMFVGNPGVGTLRPRDPQQSPWFIALPADAVNIAFNKPVTASDAEPLVGTLSMVTDGVKSCLDGDFVELAAGAQYVQIDLLRTSRVDGVGLWHNCSSPRVYHAVQIWLSNDPDFKNGIVLFNNDRGNLLGHGAGTNELYLETHLGLIQTLRPVAGRYLRAYSRGNTANALNHYLELEVYGREL